MTQNEKKIETLRQNLGKFSEYVKAVESGKYDPVDFDLFKFVESRGGSKRMTLAMQQLKNGNVQAAMSSLRKVQTTICEVAADTPFEIGAKVCLERSEHGWHNGSVCGKVVRFDGLGYDVLLNPEDGGYEVYVQHTRDMSGGW